MKSPWSNYKFSLQVCLDDSNATFGFQIGSFLHLLELLKVPIYWAEIFGPKKFVSMLYPIVLDYACSPTT